MLLQRKDINIFLPFDQYALSGGSFVRKRASGTFSDGREMNPREHPFHSLAGAVFPDLRLCKLHIRGRVLTEKASPTTHEIRQRGVSTPEVSFIGEQR